MPKLKSLRGAVGSYGRVAAGGIVDVSEDDAKKLLKTKRFTVATEADIKAAQERQKAELATETVGATPGFSALPVPPAASDRLQQMIATGQIERDKARELVALQINLSTDEVRAFIKSEADRMFAEVADAQDKLAEREADFAKREADLAARTAAHEDPDANAKADAEAAAKGKADADKKAGK